MNRGLQFPGEAVDRLDDELADSPAGGGVEQGLRGGGGVEVQGSFFEKGIVAVLEGKALL